MARYLQSEANLSKNLLSKGLNKIASFDGVKINNLQLIKSSGGSLINYLPSIRLDKPIIPQVKAQAKATIEALSGRAKNMAVQATQDPLEAKNALLGTKRQKIVLQGKEEIYDKSTMSSLLGTDITDYIKLTLPSAETGETTNIETPEKRWGTSLTFLDSHAVISVTQQKNILLTPVQGRDKTRKEYISGGDYLIKVSGMVVSEHRDAYPYTKVRDLIRILNSASVLEVQSPFLSTFEINGLIVLDYDIPQRKGFHNVQEYSFSAVYEPSYAVLVQQQQETRQKYDELIEEANGWVLLDGIMDKLQLDKILTQAL